MVQVLNVVGERREMAYTLLELVEKITEHIAQMQDEAQDTLSDLTMRQFYYLESIYRLSGPTLTALAEALAISKPSATNMVKQLEQTGYVQKIPSPDDGRSILLYLTEKGAQFREMHDLLHGQIAAYLTQNLTEKEIQDLTHLLNKAVR